MSHATQSQPLQSRSAHTHTAQVHDTQTFAALQRKIAGIGLILAPLLLGVGTFFWRDGELGLIAGTVQHYSYVFWIPALFGLFRLVRAQMPRMAAAGTLLAAWVCLAGNNFGVEGIYLEGMERAGIGPEQMGAVGEAALAAQILTFYLPGVLFPLTLLLVGVLLWRTRSVPAWTALLLCLGAVAFPLSRMPRIQWLAHAADLLLLVAMAWLGWQFLTADDGAGPQSSPLIAQ